MSEYKTDSSEIKSEVPRLQKLRSVDDAREWTVTTENNSKITAGHNIDETRESTDQSGTKGPGTDYDENKTDAKKREINEQKDISTDEHGNFALPKKESKYDVSETPSAEKSVETSNYDKKENKSNFEEENTATNEEKFVYSPVITVTKEETALTKGDLKLQKVIVSEDISDESLDNNFLRVTQAQSPAGKPTVVSGVLPVAIRNDTQPDGKCINEKSAVDDQKVLKNIQTKIPRLRLKQVVERVKEENKKKRHKRDAEVLSAQKQRSSIPKLKDIKNPPQDIKKEIIQDKKVQDIESPILDDEFDKIYEEIIESEATTNVPSLETISNPIKLESKFEEIIHAYDENNVQPISVEKPKSKIPLLKRKSDQEIEISLPNQRKDSLKSSNAEDPKGDIPGAIVKEKPIKSNIENVKDETKSSNVTRQENRVKTVTTQTSTETKDYAKTLPSVKVTHKDNNIITNKNDELPDGHANNSKIRTMNTQTSIESEEMFKSKSTVGRTEKSNTKYTSECKIPVALNVKRGVETKINSTYLNKQPTRINALEKISQTATDKVADQKIEQSHPLAETQNVKSSSIVHHIVHHIDVKQERDSTIKSVEIDKTRSFLQQEIKSLEAENNIIIKQKIQDDSKKQINEPSLTEPKKLTKIANKEVKSPSHLESCQFDIKTSNINEFTNELTPEKKFDLIRAEQKDNFPTTPVHTKNTTNKNKTTDNSQVKSENKDITRQVSNIKNKVDISIIRRNESKKNVDYKQGENREQIETLHSSIKEPMASNNVKDLKNSTDKNNNNFSIDSEKVNIFKQESKENHIYDSNQTKYKIENTLNSSTKIAVNNRFRKAEPKNKKVATHNDIPEKQNISIMSQRCEKLNKSLNTSESHVIKETNEAIQTNTNPNTKEENEIITEDISINLEEKEEEEIITLRGKVSRVIKRLDSKDPKIVKKEIDDIPKEVKLDIAAKIAMFEKSESDTLLKATVSNDVTLHQDSVNDKPKIVNELLKIDINQNQIQLNDAYSRNSEITSNKSNFVVDKLSEIGSKSDLQTNHNGEGIKIQQTESNGENNEDVFVRKDKDDASLEIWKEYRRKKEQDSDMRRARSLAELDLGDAVRGRVRQMVVRMSSVDRGRDSCKAVERRERLLGRGESVSQRIALYEGKLTSVRREELLRPRSRHGEAKSDQLRKTEEPDIVTSGYGEEELKRRIEELRRAAADYSKVETVAYVELGDGGRMPALALGTATLDPALVEHVISAGIELGYRAIDAAYIYGNEREVGRAINNKIRDGTVTRSELFIINKLWSTFHRRDLVEKACRQSLEAMGLDYFDLYLIHNPMSFKEGSDPLPRIANVLQYSQHDYLEAWFGVEELVRRGVVRRGGISNFNSHQVERVVEKGKIKPVINQVECHPYLTQLRLEEFCLSRNVKLSCFGVLGSKGTPTEFTSGLPPVIDDPLVQVMAAGLGVTPAQLLISYQLSLGRGVVVKCSSARHLAEALAVTSPTAELAVASPTVVASPTELVVASPAPRLQASHVAALSALNRNKRIFTFRGMGDTHRNYPFKIPF